MKFLFALTAISAGIGAGLLSYTVFGIIMYVNRVWIPQLDVNIQQWTAGLAILFGVLYTVVIIVKLLKD